MSVRKFVLARMRALTRADPPPVRVVFWDGEVFEFRPGATVTLRLLTPSVGRALLTGNVARLAAHYVAGDLAVDGPIDQIVTAGVALTDRFGKLASLVRIIRPWQLVSFRHSRRNDAIAIGHHYDVSNEFYRLWLDDSMSYSCAYFPTGTEDIDEGQRQKIDHICRKLQLKAGDNILDIGCGWGGLLCRAASRFGATGVGVTNSRLQHSYACERVAGLGLGERLHIALQDYRDIAGDEIFDKIVSVGMYEHVGLRHLSLYFRTITRLLKPGGAVLNHGIFSTDPSGRVQGPAAGDFIDRYVFPGGELPSLPRALGEMARNDLEIADVEDLRPHYARTLQLWSQRFESRRDALIAAAGAERYRVWRVYLAGMAHAFERGWLSVAQVLAYKPIAGRPAPRPWSRVYQYSPEVLGSSRA
jgi:cyclopropane-fatty-acyl-phospholipid synthase